MLMEKNGLLVRTPDEKDARLKKIKLTQKALDIHERHNRHIESFENAIREGISDEEMEEFFRIMDKLSDNVSRAELEHIYPEEENNNA